MKNIVGDVFVIRDTFIIGEKKIIIEFRKLIVELF